MDAKEQKELAALEQRDRERLEQDHRLQKLRAIQEIEQLKQREMDAARRREESLRPRPESAGLAGICRAWNQASEDERQQFLNRKLGMVMIAGGALQAVQHGVAEMNDPSQPLPLRGTSASVAEILARNGQ